VIGLARPVSGIGQTDGQNWQNNAAMFMQSMLTRDKKNGENRRITVMRAHFGINQTFGGFSPV